MPEKAAPPAMEMPGWLDWLGGVVERRAGFWQRLGDLESRVFSAELEAVRMKEPVFVAGLARAGTTILLEMLAGRPGVATHRYRDFPPVYTPLFWNRAFAHIYKATRRRPSAPTRTASSSPPTAPRRSRRCCGCASSRRRTTPARCQVLDAATSNPAFERFYRDHLRKILLVRGGTRYLGKGNYNLTRLAYLLKLFPDARFVVPVRDPPGTSPR